MNSSDNVMLFKSSGLQSRYVHKDSLWCVANVTLKLISYAYIPSTPNLYALQAYPDVSVVVISHQLILFI
ncbi:hypothetical protein TNCV_3853621 [Trichonephila clavipes]|nr:hypothetical protein TNCV_3853621 [Trichonephila clavipes]